MTNSRELKLTKVVSPRLQQKKTKNSDRNNTPIRHERPKIATSGKTSYRQILNHTHYYEVIHREGNAVVIQDSNGDNKMRDSTHEEVQCMWSQKLLELKRQWKQQCYLSKQQRDQEPVGQQVESEVPSSLPCTV